LGELQGFVENIGIRTTSVRGFDRTLTIVPNDTFTSGAVTNFSRINNWEINTQVVVAYNSTQRQLENIVARYREWLINNPDIESDPKKAVMVVRINDLTDHGFNLFLFFYAKTNQWIEHMRVREQCMLQLVRIIEEEGTSIAYPTRSVLLNEAVTSSAKARDLTKTKVSKTMGGKTTSQSVKPTTKKTATAKKITQKSKK
jgi:MscS family membrane protein